MPKWQFNEYTQLIEADHLYFFQEENDGPIKIGRGSPAKRLEAIRTGNPRQVDLLAAVANEGHKEAFWHRVFAPLKIAREWYRAEPSLVAAIDAFAREEAWLPFVEAPPFHDHGLFINALADAEELYEEYLFDGKGEYLSAKMSFEMVYTWFSKEAA